MTEHAACDGGQSGAEPIRRVVSEHDKSFSRSAS